MATKASGVGRIPTNQTRRAAKAASATAHKNPQFLHDVDTLMRQMNHDDFLMVAEMRKRREKQDADWYREAEIAF
jgi:succinylglutamate desuccinylase